MEMKRKHGKAFQREDADESKDGFLYWPLLMS